MSKDHFLHTAVSGFGALLVMFIGSAHARAVTIPVPYFKQCDPAWAEDQLGTCSTTMCRAGCAVTSSAMVYQYYGGTMTPGDLNACLTNSGGFANGCLIYWTNSCMPAGLEFMGTSEDLSEIDSELVAGRPVIARVHNDSTPQHFVVIVGNEQGAYQINDPYWDYGTISAGGYTIDSLRIYEGTPQFVCDLVLSARDATIIDDRDPCFVRHGNYWWQEDVGFADHHWWTYAVDEPQHECWAQWSFGVQTAGPYDVEVYIPESNAESRQARYTVTHAGTEDEVRLDQTAGTGWRYLGRFDFDEGKGQFVALHDNTREDLSGHVAIGFDAIRLTPVMEVEPDAGLSTEDAGPGDAGLDAGQQEDSGREGDGGAGDDGGASGRGDSDGCACRASSSGAGAGLLWAFFLLVVSFVMRRRSATAR